MTLPVECLRSLMMTLPDVIERALRARHGDHTLKVVYPMGGWSLHTAAGSDGVILTIMTPDGFKVSFNLTPADTASLAASLEQVDCPAASKSAYN